MHRPFFLYLLVLFVVNIAAVSPRKTDLKDSKVFIPWPEFKQIIDRLAEPDTIKGDTIIAPVDYLLTSATMTGAVTDNKSARFSVRYELVVLSGSALHQNGWVAVGLGRTDANAVLEAVTVTGKEVPLHTDGGEYRALFSDAGTYTLNCTYHCAVSVHEGTHRLFLPLPYTMAASLDFSISDDNADILVNGTEAVSVKTKNGVRVEMPVVTGTGLRIHYMPLGAVSSETSDSTRVTPRVYATTGLLADIRENQIRYEYRVDYQIWHKKITSFAIALPDTYSIEDVEGAGIAKWKLEKRKGNPVVSVTTNFTPEKAYSLTLRFSRKLETVAEEILVPSLRVLNVNRENGCLAVAAQPTMEVAVADSLSGLTAVDQSELHPWMRSRKDLFIRFKYIHTPYRCALDVKRHSDMPVLVAIADDVEFTTLLTAEGYVLSRLRYHIRNNHKQYMRVKTEEGWQLWSALIDGEAVMPATSGENEVLVPLKKMASDGDGESFLLELVYWKVWKKMKWWGRFAFSVPDVDINAQFINGTVWLPGDFKYGGFKGELKKTDIFTRSEYYRESKSYASSVSKRLRGNRRRNMIVNQQMSNSGKGKVLTLPVEITIPTEGESIRFNKKLTISGEKADLSVAFRKKLPDIGGKFGFLFPILFFLIGFMTMRNIASRRTPKNIALTAGIGSVAALLLLIVQVAMSNSFPGLSMVFIGAGCGLVAYVAFSGRRVDAGTMTLLILVAFLAMPYGSSAQDVYDEDEGEETFENSTVALPWSDFKTIIDKIKKPQVHDTVTVSPPDAYVISSADYDGKQADGKTIVFSVRMDVSVLEKDGWVNVPLAQGNATYPDVKVNSPVGGTAAIGTDRSGANKIVVKGKGEYTVRYRFAVPVEEHSGVSSVRFPMAFQTATSIRLNLDKPDYRVTANSIPMESRSGSTVYTGAVGRNRYATIVWQQETARISAENAMLLGQVNTFYSIGLGLIQMTSGIELNVIHQDIREFMFTLPRTVDVIDLTGPAVLTWEKADSTDKGNCQTVKVLFKYGVRDRASLELTAEQSYGDSVEQMVLPDLTLEGATRQEGYIAVGVTSNIELTHRDHSSNVVRKDRRELPSWFEGEDDVLFSYQYLSGAYKVTFDIKRHENISGLAALVERADVQSVIREDGKTITEMSMEVKNRGEQFLRVNWKRERQLWSLYCNNQPARPSYDSTTGELLVPLEKTAEQSTETSVKLVFLEQHCKFGIAGKRTLAIPAVSMPSQNINYTVYVPTEFDIIHTSGKLHPTVIEKVNRLPWFAFSLIPVIRYRTMSADFFEAPLPVSSSEVRQKSVGSQTRQAYDKKKMAETPAARVMADAVPSKAEVQSAAVFGRGGYASDIDAVLQGAGGLKDGGVGRKGVAGIGYGKGYGSGFGGGSGDADEAQRQALPTSGTESGQLSLPINVTVDGTEHSYKTVLLNSRESADLNMFYRKLPVKVPLPVHLVIILLLIIAGSYLAACFWSGLTVRKLFLGVVAAGATALLLCRVTGIVCNLTWVLVPVVFFFLWMAGVSVVTSLKSHKKKREEQEKELKDAVVQGLDTITEDDDSANEGGSAENDASTSGEKTDA